MKCGLKRVAAGPPSLRLPPPACAGRLYKQSQFGVPRREEGCRYEQTKPICPAVPGSVVQTKPNLGALGYLGAGRARPSPEPIMQNKANSAPNCAKQTQFCPSDGMGKYFAQRDLW
jgi:hypothetical protein